MKTFLKLITVALAVMFAAGVTACNNGGGGEPGTAVTLNVSPASMAFDADGIAVNNTVTVNGTAWTAAITEGEQWITISATSGADGETFTVTATATEDARSGKIKVTSSQNIMLEKTISINQDARAESVSENMANSYIVNPGAKVILPVKHAYNAWNGYFGEPLSTTAVLTTELLWMDTPGGISSGSAIASLSMFNPEDGENAGIRVVAGSKEGNALIALKADGETVWSWHIWVTSYDPENENITINVPASEGMSGFPPAPALTHVLMDRNLGALNTIPGDIDSQGLTYQFGRKDPFPSSNGQAPDSFDVNLRREIYDAAGEAIDFLSGYQQYLDNIEGIAFSVKNPNLYIIASAPAPVIIWTSNMTYSGRPPFTVEIKKDMWGGNPREVSDGNGVNFDSDKSVFDPCPAGYRIPFDSRMGLVLYDVQTSSSVLSNKGMDYGQYGYYPFSGFIMPDGNFAGSHMQGTTWGGIWMNWGGGYGGTLLDYDMRNMGLVGASSDLIQSQQTFPAYGAGVRCEKEW